MQYIKQKRRTAKVGAMMLIRRIAVIVLVLEVVLVNGDRWGFVGKTGTVTRSSHSTAEIRICNTQPPLPMSYSFLAVHFLWIHSTFSSFGIMHSFIIYVVGIFGFSFSRNKAWKIPCTTTALMSSDRLWGKIIIVIFYQIIIIPLLTGVHVFIKVCLNAGMSVEIFQLNG